MKRIAYITDLHLDEDFPKQQGVDPEANWLRVCDDIKTQDIDTLVYGGDIGEAAAHQYFFATLRSLGKPFYITLGNHDRFLEVIDHYLPPAALQGDELYQSFESDSYKFILLDSSRDVLSDAQHEWFAQQLNFSGRIVVFIHHPILPLRTPVDTMFALKGRERLQKAMESCASEITVFCAHYHMVDSQQVNNISQIISPALSYQVRKEAAQLEILNDHFGYRIIEFAVDGIHTELRIFESAAE